MRGHLVPASHDLLARGQMEPVLAVVERLASRDPYLLQTAVETRQADCRQAKGNVVSAHVLDHPPQREEALEDLELVDEHLRTVLVAFVPETYRVIVELIRTGPYDDPLAELPFEV